MKVDARTILPVPPEQAWARLVAWEEQARWMKDADSVRVVSAKREGVGVSLAVRTRVLGVPLFAEVLEVTAWEPPRRLRVAHRSFVRGTGEWTLAPVEGVEGVESGTSFVWVEDLSLPVPLLGELALRAYRPFMRRLMCGALSDLRSLLESG